jgi:ribA/ribD-fused uncharacterized protein
MNIQLNIDPKSIFSFLPSISPRFKPIVYVISAIAVGILLYQCYRYVSHHFSSRSLSVETSSPKGKKLVEDLPLSPKVKTPEEQKPSSSLPFKVKGDLTAEEQKKILFFRNGYNKMPKDVSIVFVDVPFKGKDNINYPEGWYTQEDLSCLCGFSNELQKIVEQEKGPFLFILSFSNAHSTIHLEEPAVWLVDPLPGSSEEKIKFPNVEFYFQHCKRALYAETIEDLDKRKEVIEQFRADIDNPLYLNTITAQSAGYGFEVPGHGSFNPSKWDKTKVQVMEDAIFAKFNQNPLLREMLLTTKDDPRILLQLKTDPKWGPGKDGKGENLLGVCLENVRNRL